MCTEEKYLKQLLKDNIDIELLFIKHLLDRELTTEKMGDYALNYIRLSEDQQWNFAIQYKKKINKDIFLWQDFLDSIALTECIDELTKDVNSSIKQK